MVLHLRSFAIICSKYEKDKNTSVAFIHQFIRMSKTSISLAVDLATLRQAQFVNVEWQFGFIEFVMLHMSWSNPHFLTFQMFG